MRAAEALPGPAAPGPTFCETALRLAVSSGCYCTVQCLLEHGTALAPALGPPALMIASERGLSDIVGLLVAKGADPNACADNGLSALVVAAVNGHARVVEQVCTGPLLWGGRGGGYGGVQGSAPPHPPWEH